MLKKSLINDYVCDVIKMLVIILKYVYVYSKNNNTIFYFRYVFYIHNDFNRHSVSNFKLFTNLCKLIFVLNV